MGKGGVDTDFEISKWGTLVTSFITAFSGLGLVGLGVYGLVNSLGPAFVPMTLPILAIVAGVLVFLLSIVGCFATVAEHKKIMWIYWSILLVVVIFQFFIGILALTTRGEMIESALDSRWDTLYDHKPRFIRDVEETYECCGLHNLTDRAWPKITVNVTENTCSKNPDLGFQQACLGPVMDEWEGRQTILGIGVLVLASLQFLGLIPTYYFAARLPTPDQYYTSLHDEHSRLVGSTGAGLPGGLHSNVDGLRAPTYGTQEGEASRSQVQHSLVGPPGGYVKPTGRPGAKIA